MRAVRLIAILWVVLFASGVSVARAGGIIITDPLGNVLTTPAGPGCETTCGANSATAETGDSSNDDYTGEGSSNPNQIGVDLFYTSSEYIDAVFTVDTTTDASGIATEYFTAIFTANNDTGDDWTSFTWTLFPGTVNDPGAIPDDGLDFDIDFFLPAVTSTTFAGANRPTEDQLDFTGGTVLNGFSTDFTFSMDVPETCGDPAAPCSVFTLRGTPNGATAASEPSALLLLGSGLAGLGLWRRWHS